MKTRTLKLATSFVLILFSVIAQAEDSIRTLTIVNTAVGLVLGDATDFSLYTFDRDQPNISNCSGACARVWPAALTTVADVTAPFGKINRADGTSQLTYNGAPLYRYAPDATPGDIKGDGVGGVWHLARIAK